MSSPPNMDQDTLSLKVPPHSMEAEQSVLGGLMLDNEVWESVAETTSEEDFYRYEHRLIFRVIALLADQSQPLDVVTVAEELDRIDELDNAGGMGYLGELVQNTPR